MNDVRFITLVVVYGVVTVAAVCTGHDGFVVTTALSGLAVIGGYEYGKHKRPVGSVRGVSPSGDMSDGK